MTIYISGRITGHEQEAQKQFAAAAQRLRAAGHTVINPFELDHRAHDKSWQSYMRVCIAAMMQAEAVYMLDGWTASKGARAEYTTAAAIDIEIYREARQLDQIRLGITTQTKAA